MTLGVTASRPLVTLAGTAPPLARPLPPTRPAALVLARGLSVARKKTTVRRAIAKKLAKLNERWSPYKRYKLPPVERFRIVTGDLVQVLHGSEAGKQGKVVTVDRSRGRVFVQDVNRRMVRPSHQPGQPTSRYRRAPAKLKHMPLHYSNVLLVDPVDKAPTRVGVRVEPDGSRVRFSKRTGAVIPKPAYVKKDKGDKPANSFEETPPEEAARVTYKP